MAGNLPSALIYGTFLGDVSLPETALIFCPRVIAPAQAAAARIRTMRWHRLARFAPDEALLHSEKQIAHTLKSSIRLPLSECCTRCGTCPTTKN
jgi:hypothetical protein